MNDEPWIPNLPQPVRPKPSFVDRHLGLGVRLVAIGLVVLIVKPWTFGAAQGAAVPTEAPPTVAPTATPPPVHIGFEDFAYDANIFGNREPTPHWDIWPAAYLVTYGFVIQLGGPNPTAMPVPVGSLAPVTLPTPAPSATPPTDGGPAWPSSVTVPAGYHLFVVGIDMPLGTKLVSAKLIRATVKDGSDGVETVGLTYPPSPWPDHFAVLGIPVASSADRLETWTPGIYRLDLGFDLTDTGPMTGTDHIARTIEIVVEAPPDFLGGRATGVPSP